jgi:hypothetical protein
MSKIVDLILPESNVYDNKFWNNVEKINQDYLKKYKIEFYGINTHDRVFIVFKGSTTCLFKYDELDLINKQYRLLQEIYYSRLEAKNE